MDTYAKLGLTRAYISLIINHCVFIPNLKKRERVPRDDYERQVYVSPFIANPTFTLLNFGNLI